LVEQELLVENSSQSVSGLFFSLDDFVIDIINIVEVVLDDELVTLDGVACLVIILELEAFFYFFG
jgi:hypothetical protein